VSAFLRDRIKGTGGVAWALELVACFLAVVKCLTLVFRAVAASVKIRVFSLSGLGRAVHFPLVCKGTRFGGPLPSVVVWGGGRSNARLWCLVWYPTDPS